MVLVVIILIGLAGVMGSGFRSLRNNRLEEQATQVGMQGLEFARSLTYSQVAVNPGVARATPASPLPPARFAAPTSACPATRNWSSTGWTTPMR